MPTNPDNPKFSINKEDTPEGKMRVFYSGLHEAFTPLYIQAAIETEQEVGQIVVRNAVVTKEDGTRVHPRDNETPIAPHQTVLYIESPLELYQPFMERVDALRSAAIQEAELIRRQNVSSSEIPTTSNPFTAPGIEHPIFHLRPDSQPLMPTGD